MEFSLVRYTNFYSDQVLHKLVSSKYLNKYTRNTIFSRLLNSLNLYNNELFLLINPKAEALGCLVLRKKLVLPNMHNKWFIYGVVIRSDQRGKGLGNALLSLISDVCKKKGINSIFLYVERSNFVAINLYKKHGFEIIPASENSDKLIGFHKNEFLMKKILGQTEFFPDINI